MHTFFRPRVYTFSVVVSVAGIVLLLWDSAGVSTWTALWINAIGIFMGVFAKTIDYWHDALEREKSSQKSSSLKAFLCRCAREGDELIDEIRESLDRFTTYQTQAKREEDSKSLDNKVRDWVLKVASDLDAMDSGLGVRFRTIGTPTKEDTDIGSGRFHQPAGCIRLHQKNVAKILSELG